MPTREFCDKVGISNGLADDVLKALVGKGLVKLGNFKNNPHNDQYAYLLTLKGIREKSLLTHSFIELKRQEFGDVKAKIQALEEEASQEIKSKTTPKGKR